MKRLVNGIEVEVESGIGEVNPGSDRLYVRSNGHTFSALAVRQGDNVTISYRGNLYRVDKPSVSTAKGAGHVSGQIRSPMPGMIVEVFVSKGDTVIKGQKLLVLEAMKTQQSFSAPFDGVVTEVGARAGEQVAEGAILVVVEAAEQA